VSDIALATHGLNKNFGALKVTQDVRFQLPVGARHALIGPNGAGKTTFINLLTGMLAPDSGTIELDGKAITALSPQSRVKRGLARTYQINTLFPDLTPLEAVTLVVCERRGISRQWFPRLAKRQGAIEEAYALLAQLGIGDQAHRLTRHLAYGHQRVLEIALALATQPHVLLLDEPAAGVPSAESHIILDAIDGLPEHIAVLIIEHDMDVVFRFARRVTVMVRGAVFAEGTPREIEANAQVREVYLGQAARPLERSAGHG
jgi:ABC-type branched-subunit amino acid transport system ATPase component